jgi:hypothetical protein
MLVLDQGKEGSCVGHAWAHELAAEPVAVYDIDHDEAVRIYWEAQRNDPWPGGEYPGAWPRYSGAAVLGGAKAAKIFGYIEGYYWAFSFDEFLAGLSYHGPSVIGIKWYRGMTDIDDNGYIHPRGRKIGGHAILATGVDMERERITLHNSWGPDWGMNGRCWISFDDMALLLDSGGEACFARGRKEPVRMDSYL